MVDIDEPELNQFRDEGFFFAGRVLAESALDELRDECDRLRGVVDRELDESQREVIDLTRRDNRYFIRKRYTESEVVRRFAFGELIAEVCRHVIGPDAYLFMDEFVIKCPRVGASFGWHQDSGYVRYPHRPYFSCWFALDEVDEDNGTLYLLPYSRAGTRSRVDHVVDAETNERIGYWGDDPGVPVVGPAGTMAVFSSVTFHRSGPNRSDRPRRALILQYSPEPVLTDTGCPWSLAVPFLRGGSRVESVPS